MAVDLDPIVDNWYKHLDKPYRFKVIAVDEDNAIVEIQKFDGSVEEIDIDDWFEMDITSSEAPQDWDVSASDYSTIEDINSEDWIIPSDDIQSDGYQEFEEHWDDGFQEVDPWDNNL